MKIAVFNVKFSENLGDGILAQCLENALCRDGNMEVQTIDLAGREGFGATSRHRRSAVRALHVLPSFARRLAVTQALRSKLRALGDEWDRKISASDAVVLGGGNLFQDDDLNFPLKIGTLLDRICRSGKPLAIYGVGVSGAWSARAHQLFQRVQETNLVYLSVRDRASRDHWLLHFPKGQEPVVVPDPGLLARDLLSAGADAGVKNSERRVGICITDPLILARHSKRPPRGVCFSTLGEYELLIRLLVERGEHVCLFCNGAREDQAFAERIFSADRLAPSRAAGLLRLAERPGTPEELMDVIRSNSVVLAHRLHACIAAYALGIPHVGLGWDQKVESFFRSVGRENFFADGPQSSPQRLCLLLQEAAANGIDKASQSAGLAAAAGAVRSLGDHLLTWEGASAGAEERHPASPGAPPMEEDGGCLRTNSVRKQSGDRLSKGFENGIGSQIGPYRSC